MGKQTKTFPFKIRDSGRSWKFHDLYTNMKRMNDEIRRLKISGIKFRTRSTRNPYFEPHGQKMKRPRKGRFAIYL